MGKFSKTLSLIAVIILSAILLKNLFSKPEEPFNPAIYDLKLKPISYPEKAFPDYEQNPNDAAVKYTRLWKLAEIYTESSDSCLKTFSEQHPNTLVQKSDLTSLYGIEIGTPKWFELTAAFEKYTSEACYSFSGEEVETEYARLVKRELSQEEILELLRFFNTDLGKRYIQTSNNTNDGLLEFISKRQHETVTRELEIYNKKIEELQNIK